MLHSLKDLEGHVIHATDGTIGHMRDFYFDDEAWVVRYLIGEEQAKSSPDIDTAESVWRQYEMRYLGYYNYPYYWGGAGLWGGGAYPVTLTSCSYDDSATEYGDFTGPCAASKNDVERQL